MARPTIVLGLGNPGRRYHATRHNLGFWVVDRMAEGQGRTFRSPGRGASYEVAEGAAGGAAYVLAKPVTFMNLAGTAAAALRRKYGAAPEDFVVVYDDADLGLGRVRIRTGGSAGGHNGVRSVIERLGTPEFVRLRLGVRGSRRGEEELADYVLERFDPDERAAAEALADLGREALEAILRDGLVPAMNAFNGRQANA